MADGDRRGLVVSNTTPISNLIKIGQLPLAEQMFNRVLIPIQVAAELEQGSPLLRAWRESPGAGCLVVITPMDGPFLRELETRLDAGEAAAIALAVERSAALLLIDEVDGRAVAAHHGLAMTGTLGLLLEAKRERLIDEVRPHIDALIRSGFHLSPALKAKVLITAGEAVR